MLTLIRTIGLLFSIMLLLLVGMMSYLRQSPSTAMWIAFASDGKIYRMDADGSNLRQLTDGSSSYGYEDLSPFWSPDAQWIGFVSSQYEFPSKGFYRVSRNGGEVEPILILSQFNDILDADISPDGQWIVMTASTDGLTYDIYRVGVDDSAVEQLTNGPEYSTNPRYTSDGQSILFTYGLPHSEQHIYQMMLNGSQPVRIPTPPIDPVTPSLSPNGEWIVFSASPDSYLENEIMKMRVDGSDLQQLTYGDGYYYSPSWSPNGEWIVFVTVYGLSQTIYKIRPDGTDDQRLTTVYGDSPSWSPIIDLNWSAWQLTTIGLGSLLGAGSLSLWNRRTRP